MFKLTKKNVVVIDIRKHFDKHVQIVFVIGNVHKHLPIICQYVSYKGLYSIGNIWEIFDRP